LGVKVADNSATFMKVGLFGAALYVAYSQGWLSFLGLGTAKAVSTTGTAATGASANSPAAVVPVTSTAVAPSTANTSRSLDAIYADMTAKAKAAGESASLGVDAWGYYLNQTGITGPDPMPIFSAAVPNFDRSQTFTSAQYWAIMAPALQSQLGLSGLGLYGGLGAVMRRYA
jgi:hypothetical protein